MRTSTELFPASAELLRTSTELFPASAELLRTSAELFRINAELSGGQRGPPATLVNKGPFYYRKR